MTKNGVTVSTKDYKGQSGAVKTNARVKCSLQHAWELIVGWQQERTSATILNLEFVQKYEDNHFDLYMQSTLPFPFSNRDWVFTTWRIFEPNRAMAISYSIERPDVPKRKKFVRGDLLASGLLITPDPDPDYINLVTVQHGDLRGVIPLWVLNSSYKFSFKASTVLKEVLEGKREISTRRFAIDTEQTYQNTKT